MSTIKPKKGICIDCGPESPETNLIAYRCQNHYWRHRAAVKASAKKLSEGYQDQIAQQKALDKWFATAIEQMPRCCEECGDRLIIFAPWAAKAFIAHVLPKAIFTSVRTHPLNKIYLCLICHTNFDNWGEDKVQEMKIFPKVLEISFLLSKHLKQDEYQPLPEYVKMLLSS